MYKLYLLTDNKKDLIGEYKTATKADQTARERATVHLMTNKNSSFAIVIIDHDGVFFKAYARGYKL